MKRKPTHIRTSRCRAQVVWVSAESHGSGHVKIEHMIIDVAEHKQWTEDYYKSVVSELAAKLIKVLRDAESSPVDGRDVSTYLISDNGHIELRYPGGYKVDTHDDMIPYQVNMFADRRPNRTSLWGLPLVEIARGNWPASAVPFPVFRDEFIKSVDIRLRKLRLVGDQVKKITELRGLKLKVKNFRVGLIRREVGDDQIIGKSEIIIDVVYHVDETDQDMVEKMDAAENDLGRIVDRMVRHVTNSFTYNITIRRTIEQK